jgi:hypothetical protein
MNIYYIYTYVLIVIYIGFMIAGIKTYINTTYETIFLT